MSELSFLLDLLLNEKLARPVKEKITERVKFIESYIGVQPVMRVQPMPAPKVINGAVQSPSTVAAMERQQTEVVGPSPAAVLIASPAAAQAIASRNQALNEAMSGKPEKGRTSPRKF